MLREALSNWVSLGILRCCAMDDTVTVLREQLAAVADAAPSWPTLPLPPAPAQPHTPRPIALLSLFDGSGMARLALGELLRMLGCPAALVRSDFVAVSYTHLTLPTKRIV